jgi:hypothetical protein
MHHRLGNLERNATENNRWKIREEQRSGVVRAAVSDVLRDVQTLDGSMAQCCAQELHVSSAASRVTVHSERRNLEEGIGQTFSGATLSLKNDEAYVLMGSEQDGSRFMSSLL